MSAVVTISPEGLDAEVCPAVKSLGNLAGVHRLPRLEHISLVDRDDGRTVVFIVVPEIAADQWRQAIGAPAFTPHHRQNYTQHTTERSCWFGATVRLSYTSL